MPRKPRLVLPNYPHHVVQRGNRRQQTFFCDADYKYYIRLISEAAAHCDSTILAYCLMPNHVHLVVIPKDKTGLAKLFQEAHKQYTRYINQRNDWRGHLWQERFHSFAMDERHLLAAVRYVELNPVRAKLCDHAWDWHWSSVHAHIANKDDDLVSVSPMLNRINDWHSYLGEPLEEEMLKTIRKKSNTGRPAGSKDFLTLLSKIYE